MTIRVIVQIGWLKNKIFVVWDQEDPSTDWRLLSAIYIAMGRSRPKEKSVVQREMVNFSEVIAELKVMSENHAEMRKKAASLFSNSKDLKGLLAKDESSLQDCIKKAEEALKDMQPKSSELTVLRFEHSDAMVKGEEE